jgi:hypothetical protein
MLNSDREIETIGWISERPATASDWLLGAVTILGIAALVYLLIFL